MQLVLRVTKDTGEPLAHRAKVFDEEGGTVGRAPGNDWVLPDSKRYLSGRHAAVYFRDGAYYIADTSANGVFVNDSAEPLGSDNLARLQQGDRLHLGDYELAVEITDGGEGRPAEETQSQGGSEPNVDDPFDIGALSPDSADPLAALSAPPRERPPSQAAERAGSGAPGGPPGGSPPNRADWEFERDDPPGFSGSQGASAQQWGLSSESGLVTSDPLEFYNRQGERRLPDDEDLMRGTGSEARTESDHAPTLESSFKAPPPAQLIPEDWDASPSLEEGLGEPQPRTEEPPPQDAEPAPSQPRAPAPAARMTEKQSAPIPPQASEPLREPGRTENLDWVYGFLEGAGLEAERLAAQAPPEMERLLGEIFRQIVEDLREVLVARSELKRGFRMSVTTIRPADNNPLKFAAGGVDEALHNLLFPSGRGYLPPREAFHEGFQDIKTHQLAMIAGLRASLRAVLERFDPERLEREFAHEAARGMPLSNKKARYWELYKEWYGALRADADDEVQMLFGQDFADAYEAQTEKLSAAKKRQREG